MNHFFGQPVLMQKLSKASKLLASRARPINADFLYRVHGGNRSRHCAKRGGLLG